MFPDTSGNIKSQIGHSLNSIRAAVEAGDVLGVAQHFDLLVALCAPVLSPEEREKFRVPEMPAGKDKEGRKAQQLYREITQLLADLLCVLRDNGLYAYKAPPLGDASDLALTDPVPNE